MRASRCRVKIDAKHDLPLSHSSASGSWTSRPSALIHLISKDGTTGTGELAPLPGYSVDDFDACHKALAELDPIEFGPQDFGKPRILLARVEAMIPRSLPAARFALSSAAMDWVGQQAGISAWELLVNPTQRPREDPVPLSALLPTTTAKERLAAAEELLQQGYTSLKLKLGADIKAATAEAHELSKVITAGSGGLGSLRLDANQGLPRESLSQTLTALSEAQPELLEEPARGEDWVEWLENGSTPPFKLAADESLFSAPASIKAWLGARHASVVVLKPTCLGLARTLDLAEQAKSIGADVTISHCFEGPVGYTAVSAVALAIASRDVASGLAPYPTLAALRANGRKDFIPRYISGGKLVPWATSGLDTEFAVRG